MWEKKNDREISIVQIEFMKICLHTQKKITVFCWRLSFSLYFERCVYKNR